jgi:hypothetical protein
VYTFPIPGAPADHRARAFALWDAAPHRSIGVPVDVADDLSTASFPRGDRVLGAMPKHSVRASLWLRDVVDGVRAALAFGFSRFRAPELSFGRPSLIFGVDEEWASPSRVGAKHRLIGELFGFRGHRVSRAALSLLPPAVAAVAGSDTDDLDALSSSLSAYLASGDARAAVGRVAESSVAEQLTREPELLAFADIVDDVVRVHGHDAIMRVGTGAPHTTLLALLPALDDELVDVVADADRGVAARANAALVLGWKRARVAVPALLAVLRDAEEPLLHAALDALARIPGERGVVVDDESHTVTPCPHDFRAAMPMQAELRRYCPDCRATVTPVRLLRRRRST